jgi:DNA adenine methylase
VIRVPTKLAPEILRHAHEIDGKLALDQLSEPTAPYRTAADIEPTRPVNVASVPRRSPFRYPGGKTWLVPYIRSWLGSRKPTAGILIEPFAGGGIVALTAAFDELAEHCVLVERDSGVAAVWHTILSGQAPWLIDRILKFDLNKETVTTVLGQEALTQRERAFAVILRNRVQRGGIMARGAGLVKSGENGNGIRSRWYPETLARRIQEIATVRERLTFIEGDGLEVIRRYADDDTAAFFVDPPYTLAARRLYPHWQLDHRGLFQLLAGVKGDVLCTYDNTREISLLAAEFGFETQAIAMKNTHHAKMTELIIGRDLSWLRRSDPRAS